MAIRAFRLAPVMGTRSRLPWLAAVLATHLLPMHGPPAANRTPRGMNRLGHAPLMTGCA